MKYMLDTNMIIFARNSRPEIVYEMFRFHISDGLCVSAITMAELEYGIQNSQDYEKNRLALVTTLSGISILPFDEKAAQEYGLIRAYLKRSGQPIGSNDLLIAAHAKSAKAILVTNNTKEFERIPELKIEDWTKGSK